MASWQRDERGVDGKEDGGLQGEERADDEVSPGGLSEDEQRRHACVEDELTGEGPMDAVDVSDAEELLEHREVEEGGKEREGTVGESARGACGGGEEECCPVGREESGESRDGEVGRGAGVAERHEDDEGADDELQAEVAVRHGACRLELRVVVLDVWGSGS